MTLADTFVKIEDVKCLDSSEIKSIFEYVTNSEFKETFKGFKLSEKFIQRNCLEEAKIIQSSAKNNSELLDLKMDHTNSKFGNVSNIKILVVKQIDYFEVIPIDTFLIDLDKIKTQEYFSYIFFTRSQLKNMKSWKQIEDIESSDLTKLKLKSKEVDINTLNLTKFIPPFASLYRTNEFLNIQNILLTKIKINPMATDRRIEDALLKFK